MIQRIQTVWMVLTAALVAIVVFMPAVSFSLGGIDFRLMSYGIAGGAEGGGIVVLGGEMLSGGVTSPTA